MSQKIICFTYILTLLLLSFSLPSNAQLGNPGPLHVDEIGYCKQLFTARKDIMDGASPDPTQTNPALNALVIRVIYRPLMLKYPNSYDSIKAQYCPNYIQDMDNSWVISQQNAETDLKNNLLHQFYCLYPSAANQPNATQLFEQWLTPQNIIKPGYWAINDWVSYWIGPTKSLYIYNKFPGDPTLGIETKLYFTFWHPFVTLTPCMYYGFAKALWAAGFNGDFKSPAWAGAAYLDYNQIVLHAGTIKNAELAEQIGLKYFGSALAHESRGIDTYQTKTNTLTDFHQYLLENHGDISGLPGDFRAFLRYQN